MKQTKNYASTATYDYTKQATETTEGISLTVPDQGYTLREIITRHTRGQAVSVKNYGGDFYGEEQVLPNFAKMDLSERDDAIKEAQANVQELQKQMDADQQKLRERKKKIAAEEAAFKKEWREKNATQKGGQSASPAARASNEA